MYKYKVKMKSIFPRSIDSIANTKEELENVIEIKLSDTDWKQLEKGKKVIVEDEDIIVTIEKIKS